MGKFTNKICWITGASSGIGEALCYELSKQGAELVLSARNEKNLIKVAGNCIKIGAKKTTVVPMDLGKEESIDNAFSAFSSHYSTIDLLVNNGGLSQRAVALETSYEVERNLMQINFFGTIYLTKKVLSIMTAQKDGMIAVTSSIAGKFGFPLRTTYSATKHAVQGYFESLRVELLPYNIKINIIIPKYSPCFKNIYM